MKNLFALLLALAMVLSMVACGGNDAPAADAPAADAPAADAPAADAPATGIDPNKEYEIVFWHHESPDHRVAAFDTVIKLFTESTPMLI